MNRTATLLVAFAAFCWGISGGIGGSLIADGWSAAVVSFYRGAIGLVIAFAWLLFRTRRSGLASGRLWFWSVIAGLGVAGNFAFYFSSVSEGSVAIAAALMYSAPVFVYIASFALGLESLTPLKGIAIVIVMVGIILLTRIYDAGLAGVSSLGLITGVLAGLSYAVFIFSFKYASRHGSPQAVLTVAFAVLSALLIVPAETAALTDVLSSPHLPRFVGLGVLGAVLSFYLYITGLRHVGPATASVVAMVEPVTASLFSVFILSESLGGLQLLGIAMVLITVTALSVSSDT